MPTLYELATLELTFAGAASAPATVLADLQSSASAGTLLALWQPEFGSLSKLVVLRRFDDEATLLTERRRVRQSANPFGCGNTLVGLELDSYLPFPGFAEVVPGAYGNIYEVRTYRIKPGGLAFIMPEWAAIAPARSRFSPLLMAMYATDGTNRMMHVCPYANFEQRTTQRAAAAKLEGWPTPSGPPWMDPTDMKSAIYRPASGSPLH